MNSDRRGRTRSKLCRILPRLRQRPRRGNFGSALFQRFAKTRLSTISIENSLSEAAGGKTVRFRRIRKTRPFSADGIGAPIVWWA